MELRQLLFDEVEDFFPDDILSYHKSWRDFNEFNSLVKQVLDVNFDYF